MKFRIAFFIFNIIGIYLCVSYWSIPSFWFLITVYILLFGAIVSLGSYFIGLNFFIYSEKKGEGVVFTFDDGPNPEFTPQILEILKKFNVKATFFVIGKEAEKHSELLKRIDTEGHLIGNHSYSHSNFIPFFRAKKLYKDFEKSRNIIGGIINKKPNYIRPPFGVTSPRYTKMFRKVNFISIGWSFRSYDTTEKDVAVLIRKTLQAIEKDNKAILLFHDTMEVTVKALPKILENLKSNGTEIASLSASIKTLPYE